MELLKNTVKPLEEITEDSYVRSFMTSVFSRMFMALIVTALIAYFASGSASFLNLMFHAQTGALSIFGWIIMFAPLALVLLMSAGFSRMKASTLSVVFSVYAVLMGLSLSFIFIAFTGASIAKTFFITAGMFGLMALLGYTTKTDLTRFGSLMFMGLIGLIIASLVNFFMNSNTLDYIISFIGVLVFTGLTAYDVQKLKRLAIYSFNTHEQMRKAAIMGALTLYLDFINLFLFLLRFFGNRK
jgi:FtsH-binding integral membrane protein